MSTAGRRVRVLAADRHPLYRDALTRAIRQRPELELVAQAADGRAALDAIGAEQLDVAVIDGTLAGPSGDGREPHRRARVLTLVGDDGHALPPRCRHPGRRVIPSSDRGCDRKR